MEEYVILTSTGPYKHQYKPYFLWAFAILLSIYLFASGEKNNAILLILVMIIGVNKKCSEKHQELNLVKYKFVPDISNKDIFEVLQPALISKYGELFDFECNDKGEVVVTCDYAKYVIVRENDCFSIEHSSNSFLRNHTYYRNSSMYKLALRNSPIIAYELQQAFGITATQQQTDEAATQQQTDETATQQRPEETATQQQPEETTTQQLSEDNTSVD